MKAITFQGVGDVRVETVADPKVVDAGDVVLRITTSAVCGSDLHQYHGRGGGLVEPGSVMGHEFMGVVEEAGPGVRTLRAGDRVVAPFSVSCGHCEWCRSRLPTQCTTTSRAVFGGRFGKVFPGGQAERIRVPFADHLCEKVPAEMSDAAALFLGDILSTGYACAENGGIRPGDTVAVFGQGRSGCSPCRRPSSSDPARVLAVDRVDYRLTLAAEFGAEPVSLERGDPAEQLRARRPAAAPTWCSSVSATRRRSRRPSRRCGRAGPCRPWASTSSEHELPRSRGLLQGSLAHDGHLQRTQLHRAPDAARSAR